MLLYLRWLIVGIGLSINILSGNNLPLSRVPRLSPQAERDVLYTWLAYAVVQQDWQRTSQPDSSRGFNIGSVLVSPAGYPVYWARNAVNKLRNQTQHGEVRLLQGYLGRTRQFALPGYTVYTTLEPCAMCSGMLTHTRVRRVVYGQRDPAFGSTLQRLQLDSRAVGRPGYAPYPWVVEVVQSPDSLSSALDAAYQHTTAPTIVRFLATAGAHRVYQQATRLLATYRPQHPENQAPLDSARRLLARVTRQADE
jgi:tRNA(Arg) A34 adenosine deaminase TadA